MAPLATLSCVAPSSARRSRSTPSPTGETPGTGAHCPSPGAGRPSRCKPVPPPASGAPTWRSSSSCVPFRSPTSKGTLRGKPPAESILPPAGGVQRGYGRSPPPVARSPRPAGAYTITLSCVPRFAAGGQWKVLGQAARQGLQQRHRVAGLHIHGFLQHQDLRRLLHLSCFIWVEAATSAAGETSEMSIKKSECWRAYRRIIGSLRANLRFLKAPPCDTLNISRWLLYMPRAVNHASICLNTSRRSCSTVMPSVATESARNRWTVTGP